MLIKHQGGIEFEHSIRGITQHVCLAPSELTNSTIYTSLILLFPDLAM